MMAYGGNNLLNMVLNKFYDLQRHRFKGSGTKSGFSYTFDVTRAPEASLSTGKNYNLKIDTKVAVTAKRGNFNFNKTVLVTTTGKVALNRGKLSITRLRASTSSPASTEKAVIEIVNQLVIPKIRKAISLVPVPQLTRVFGTRLSVRPVSGTVINGPAVEMGARISGKSRTGNADKPTSANIKALNSGSASNALMIAMLSKGAVNMLIKEIPPQSHTFDERKSKFKLGAGIKGTIRATTPVLDIRNGKGHAKTTIYFSSLRAGIKVPFKGWTWIGIPRPKINVGIIHSLSVSRNRGVVTLKSLNKISVPFSWPKVLKPAEKLLKTLINGILRMFGGLINRKVRGKRFELFRLPATIPGTRLRARLSFDNAGLGYYQNSVRAIVRIRT